MSRAGNPTPIGGLLVTAIVVVGGASAFALHAIGELGGPVAPPTAAVLPAPTAPQPSAAPAPSLAHAPNSPSRPAIVHYLRGPIGAMARVGTTPATVPPVTTPAAPVPTTVPAPSAAPALPPTVATTPTPPSPPAPAPAPLTNGPTSPAPPAPTSPPPPGELMVPASIPSDCSAPVESRIMQWLATVPDHSTVAFQAGGCYGEDQSIVLDRRNGLTIDGNGATFRALTLSEGNPNRANWMVLSGSNITFENMTLRGANNRSFPAPTRDVEWQHGISLAGTQAAIVRNVSIYDVWGDFIEASSDPYKSYTAGATTNLSVDTVHLDHSGRQGLGLTNINGFTITNSYLGNVPDAGIDLEPDTIQEVVENVAIRGNTFGPVRNAVVSMGGWLSPQTANGITVADNTMAAGVSTCDAPLWIGPQPGGGVTNYSATGNHFNSISTMANVNGLTNATFSGNTVSFYGSGCDGKGTWGVTLHWSSNISVVENAFLTAAGPVSADAASTNITVSGNTR